MWLFVILVVYGQILLCHSVTCPQNVPVINYRDNPISAADLVTTGCPQVIRGGPWAHWRATRTWSPAYLASPAARARLRTPPVLTVKTSVNPVFMYEDLTKPLKQGNQCHVQKQNMSLTELFHSLGEDNKESEDVKTYKYFSDGISALKEISQDILPIDYISRTSHCDINIWAGSRGVVAHPHYDIDDNFFVQISGRKRVLLLSPATWVENESLFPHLHPLHRQLQNDTDGGTTVDVVPGDLLFIPSFWVHKVTSLESAISVNFWCESAASRAVRSLLALSLEDSIKLSVPHYLRTILAIPVAVSSVALFRRYGASLRNPSLCGESAGNQSAFDQVAQRIAHLLAPIDPFIQSVILCDFVEEVALWAAGIDNLGSFLLTCIWDVDVS